MKLFVVGMVLGSGLGYKAKPRQKQYTQPEYPRLGNKLAFQDDFSKLDMNKWHPEITAGGGGNWEFQFYNNDRRTSFVEDNVLYIKPMLTMDYLGMDKDKFLKEGALNLWGNAPGMQCTANAFYGCERSTQGDNIVNPIMSAQLRTVDSFNFKYGRVEIEAKMPRGDWIWPAIWLMPKHHAYGGWPASGEIDIVESRGNLDNCHGDGVSTVSSALHWGTHWSKSMYNLTSGKITSDGTDFSRKFTKFTLEWTQERIRTLADGKVIMDVHFDEPLFKRGKYSKTEFNPWANSEKSRNNAPFDEEFYLILNVAVGGVNGFFPDTPGVRGVRHQEALEEHRRKRLQELLQRQRPMAQDMERRKRPSLFSNGDQERQSLHQLIP
ncbi:3-glucan binding protein [Entomophthora muscae]|uniref:3-glucan binding protein n=1 Tax=Entomophthora muscae TaxID=34485 RepID=A0ACC2TNN1_9FUNG|nr:3-glucan binding protein [Entomophthora muscae]